MRKIFLSLFISLIALSFMTSSAEAKRFGGGKSFGVKREASAFSRPTQTLGNTASRAEQAATAAKPASTASKWLGPLAGLAAGGLLASLFMGHGIGSGIFSWLLIGALVFFVLRFMSRMMATNRNNIQDLNFQTQAANSSYQPTPMPANNPFNRGTTSQFDETNFLRQAKALFIRLQAAYDSKNLADIREFTSPEISAEIQLQFQECGNNSNFTEVVDINAELVNLSTESGMTEAGALFTGLVREEMGAEPVNVKEIWHFRKNETRDSWVVIGIQQA